MSRRLLVTPTFVLLCARLQLKTLPRNSLPKTVVCSDSVTLLPVFLSSLCSLTHCLATAPLKLRPYGAMQICLLLLVVVVCDLTRRVEKLEFLFILLTRAENDASTLLVSVFLTCVHWRDCPSVSLCTRLQRKTFLFVDSIVHNYYVLSVGWPRNSANGQTVIQKVPNILEGSVATHLTCVVGSWMTILLQRLCCGWRWKSRLSFRAMAVVHFNTPVASRPFSPVNALPLAPPTRPLSTAVRVYLSL